MRSTCLFGGGSCLRDVPMRWPKRPRTRPRPRPRTHRPPQTEEPDVNAWSFSASAYTYIVPDDGNYVQPTFTADRGWLHLEARYNYEALDTGSAWVGYNFSGGERLAWEFTPMLGGVFGDTTGVAPGYKGSLGWLEARTLQRGRACLRHGRFLRQLFLQLVGADAGAGGPVPVRTRDAADARLQV